MIHAFLLNLLQYQLLVYYKQNNHFFIICIQFKLRLIKFLMQMVMFLNYLIALLWRFQVCIQLKSITTVRGWRKDYVLSPIKSSESTQVMAFQRTIKSPLVKKESLQAKSTQT